MSEEMHCLRVALLQSKVPAIVREVCQASEGKINRVYPLPVASFSI